MKFFVEFFGKELCGHVSALPRERERERGDE